MSDDFAIYDAIAVALAEAREPDLASFDPAEVRTALERVLLHSTPRGNFLAWLNSRVQLLSDGQVSIEERPDDASPGERASNGAPAGTAAPALRVRRVVQGEPFAEPAVVRAGDRAVEFPMRG